jgi:Multiubiquitin
VIPLIEEKEKSMATDQVEAKNHGPQKFQIQIDRVHYTVHQDHMTATELRQVPPVPIKPDRDLFEVVPGGPDRKIGDADIVEIHNGKRFFTAPAQINPGLPTQLGAD